YAPDSGKITGINNTASAYFGGKYIVLEGKSGYRFYMGHNSENNVKVGQAVTEGQPIGKVGQTGFGIPSKGISAPSGPHVHFEMSKGGKTYDPSKIIKKGDSMVTEMIANCIRRFYTGKDCTKAELKKYVGKVTPDEFRKQVMSWP